MRKLQQNSKAVIVLIVVAMLALMAGVVSAQEPPGPGGPGGNGGNGGPRPGDLPRGARQLIALVAEQTGLTGQEIVEQVRDGATLAEIITANGGDVQVVVDAVLANATERLSEAVANERITQEQMDTRLATIETNINALLNGEFEPRGDGLGNGGPGNGGPGNGGGNGNGGPGPRDGVRAFMNALVEATGLEVSEIRDQLRDGATPAEVVEANGGDVQAVIDSIVATITTHVNERVEAGQMTQERADEILSELAQRVTDFMNSVRPVMPANADV